MRAAFVVSAMITPSPGPLHMGMHAHVQRTGAAAGGNGVVKAQVRLERLLEANNES